MVLAVWNMLLPPLPWQILGRVLLPLDGCHRCHLSGVQPRHYLQRYVGAQPLACRYLPLGRDRPKWQALDRAIAASGWKAVPLLRLSNILPSNIANYACGLTALPMWTIVWASWWARPLVWFSRS